MDYKSNEIVDDEEDYMSETFIQQAEKNPVPGLTISKAIKRKHQLDKKQRDKQIECLEEGLSKPIDSSNKGFKLMQKMGFVNGSTLGLSQSSNAIKDPIAISLKRDRSCLGREKHFSKVKISEITEGFKSKIQEKFQNNFLKKDLRKSLRACYYLDTDAGLEKPIDSKFWPETSKEFESDSEEVDEENTLRKVTLYLRSKHFYCIWCGIKFESNDDLTNNCPGESRSDHD